jgi:hypothetical protein
MLLYSLFIVHTFSYCSDFWVLDKSGLGLGRCWRSRTDGHSVVSGLISLLLQAFSIRISFVVFQDRIYEYQDYEFAD